MAAVLPITDDATKAAESGSLPTSASIRPGTIVSGTYRVRERLGAGGMGEVFEVEHLRLRRTFAAKFLRASLRSDPTSVARFEDEARALSTVRSAHVVGIVDYGADSEGVPFFVMERLFGEDLRSMLKREGALAVPRACALSIAAAAGLKAIHAVGLIHADVKPANLFVCSDDLGLGTCKLLDLGLARSAAVGWKAGTTLGAGTVRYMAPEQLAGDRLVDQQIDVYALGAVLYECLAGRPLHDDECVERMIYAIMHSRPKPLAELGVAAPRELEAAVLRALSPEPDARFAGANDLIAALEPFARGIRSPALWTPSGPDDATGELRNSWFPSTQPSRRRLGVAFAAGLALGASASLIPALVAHSASKPSAREVSARAEQPPATISQQAPMVIPSVVPLAPTGRSASPFPSARTSEPATLKTPSLSSARPRPQAPHSGVTGVFDRSSPYDADDGP